MSELRGTWKPRIGKIPGLNEWAVVIWGDEVLARGSYEYCLWHAKKWAEANRPVAITDAIRRCGG